MKGPAIASGVVLVVGEQLVRQRPTQLAVIDREAAGRSLREITRLPLKRDIPMVLHTLRIQQTLFQS